MGYAGYAPSTVASAEKRTPAAEAMRQLPLEQAGTTLELVEKLTRNVSRSPKEEKFRCIKLSNKKIAESLTDVPGAVAVLVSMGWVQRDGDSGSELVLPAEIKLEHANVVEIIEARDFWTKERENAKRAGHREAAVSSDPEKRAAAEQLERDRKERAAAAQCAPAVKASVATTMGNGPNIVSAGWGG